MLAHDDDDPVTPDDELRQSDAAMSDEHYREFEQREQDILALTDQLAKADDLVDELVHERDDAIADAARWKELATVRYARLLEVDPVYQPSAPKDRPRFAGEDPDDYALRAER